MPTNSATPKRLVQLFHETESYREGSFVLSSGKTSNFYIDCKKAMMYAEAMYLIEREFATRIWLHEKINPKITAVGGMTIGADPIVGALVCNDFSGVDYAWGAGLRGFLIRSETKKHGLKKCIEGALQSGDRVALIEDVATTGKSLLTAIEMVKEVGAIVDLALTVVDREEGATEALAEQGVPLYSYLSIKDLKNADLERKC
jgi:orotate phosphoribosyltransferase